MFRSLARVFVVVSVVITLLVTAAVLMTVMYFYIRFTRDLPRIERISDYRPKAVTSIYAEDGTLMSELYDERRYPVKFEDIPEVVKKAFLAAEDANFYTHPGIDITSIIRALVVNLRSKKAKQGASTITQQVVKSLLLSREKTYERKAKEAILSYRLEKALTKDEIFSIYLNQIFLGSGSYGVAAAAKVHFHKKLSELNIAEAAYIAGLPQKPTQLSRLESRQTAIHRQHYVLGQMLERKMISQLEHEQAKNTPLEIFPADQQTIYAVPYFSGHVIKLLGDIFKALPGDMTATNPGGFIVQTTADVAAEAMAKRALHRGLRELDKREGWRGPRGVYGQHTDEASLGWEGIASKEDILPDTVYRAAIKKLNAKGGLALVQVGKVQGVLDLKRATWARRLIKEDDREAGIQPETFVKAGDIVEVSLDPAAVPSKDKTEAKQELVYFVLDQTPKVEGAFVAANALTGEVKVIIGGYDYSATQFNRATQGELQPGSAFKPFIYLAAIEHLGFTPSTIVPDSPISLPGGDGKIWTPQNFDHEYLGPITLRTALQRSRNVVSVYLISRLGVERAIESARKLGITTPLPPNMSLALGTAEVHLIELVHAYGAFAAEGWLADSLIVKSIKDRDGKPVYKQSVQQKKVIQDTDAFIMANMMKGVVERGTATKIKELGRPVAGKTGTTNEQMDAWFVGYTPEWVAGVWVGFDTKHTLGRMETGGKAAAPIYLYFMQEFLADKPVLDFNIPDGVIPVPVDLHSGQPVDPNTPGAFIEYFKSGTEPSGALGTTAETPAADKAKDYLSNDEF
jgi:penicillin-binding protein 1A